jgi:hypothetical protein
MFKTARPDGKSYRELALDVLKSEPVGTLIPYERLMKHLEVDDRRKVIASVRPAIKSLLKLYNRGAKCVAGVGYRILQANEHMLVATGHKSKAGRSMGRALAFFEGTDLNAMTEIERKLHESQHMLARAIMDSHRHLDKRLTRIEELLKGETIKQD